MALDGASEIVHGTAIALRRGGPWRAALIRGVSGAGKSDLALRCLATSPNALISATVALVADDQVRLVCRAGSLEVSCPAALRGKLEVRGIGIIEVDSFDDVACLDLIVELVPRADVPRLPDPPLRGELLGVSLPRLVIAAHDASAPLKLLLALRDPAVLGGAQDT